MNKEMREAVLEAADYVNTNCEKNNKRISICNSIAMLIFIVFHFIKESDAYMTISWVSIMADCLQGVAIGMILVGLIMSSRYAGKVREFKKRSGLTK